MVIILLQMISKLIILMFIRLLLIMILRVNGHIFTSPILKGRKKQLLSLSLESNQFNVQNSRLLMKFQHS